MLGKIVKGIAGFYYVCDESGTVYACRAKGIFRKNAQKPLVGDDVCFEILDEAEHEGNVTELLPRRSELIRPAVSNIDQAVIVAAVQAPDFNMHLVNRFLVLMESFGLPSLLCITKCDLAGDMHILDELKQPYSEYPVCLISNRDGFPEDGYDRLKALLRGKTTVFAGASGAGKSTLINRLCPGAGMQTGEVSAKIGRGRHTTRHTELFFMEENTYILDTPGFTSLDISGISREDLELCFPEFSPYLGECRFRGCSHISEPSCRIKSAVTEGRIHPARFEDYVAFYDEVKDIPEYIRRQNAGKI